MPVESARKLGGIELAAGQGHGLENPLVPECRFLIPLLRGAAALLSVLRARLPFLFSHKKMSFLNPDRKVEPASARLRATSLPKPTTKGGYGRLAPLVRPEISRDRQTGQLTERVVSEEESNLQPAD
jgi:hypothetical protein